MRTTRSSSLGSTDAATGGAHTEVAGTVPPAPRGALPPAFRRLLASATAANLGDGLLLVGLPLVVIQLTREPLLVAAINAWFSLPWLLFALQAGALADRRSRRALLVHGAAWRGAFLVVAGAAALLGSLPLAAIYVLVFLLGTAEVLFDTTSQSLVPDLVDREHLGRANGWLLGLQTVMNNFVGAPLAGLLVGLFGAAMVLGPAVLYLAAALVLLSLPGPYRPPARPPARMRTDIAEGLRELWQHPTLRALGLLGAVLNLANAGYFAVLVLFIVGPSSPMGLTEVGYGLLAALLAAGSVVGSLLAGRLEEAIGPRRAALGGVALTSAAMLVPVVTTSVVAVTLMAVVLGFASVLVNVVIVSSRQRIVPRALLGRVNASFRVLVMGASPLGAALGGAIASATTLRTTFVAAVVLQALALVAFHRPVTDAALRGDGSA
ncbi:MAG: MFS transporter [Nitriliruptoraceae bacterium]